MILHFRKNVLSTNYRYTSNCKYNYLHERIKYNYSAQYTSTNTCSSATGNIMEKKSRVTS